MDSGFVPGGCASALRTSLFLAACLVGLQLGAQDCGELVERWPYGTPFLVSASGNIVLYSSGTVLQTASIAANGDLTDLGGVELPDIPRDLVVVGNLAYVADYGAGVRVVDLSDPASPAEVGSCPVPGLAWGIDASATRLYVGAGDGGIRVLSLAPQPQEVGFLETPTGTGAIVVSEGKAYVAGGCEGTVGIYDLSDEDAPVQIGCYAPPGYWGVMDLALDGGRLFVAGGTRGLRILDLSNPASPSEVGAFGEWSPMPAESRCPDRAPTWPWETTTQTAA